MEEKITVSAEFSQTDVTAALMCLGEELTPEIWEQIKAAPSKFDYNKIEDKSERMQVKLGLICLLFHNLAQNQQWGNTQPTWEGAGGSSQLRLSEGPHAPLHSTWG